MGFKSFLSKPIAAFIAWQTSKWSNAPHQSQQKIFEQIISKAKHTKFGRDHQFQAISSHSDFVKNVPVRDYEQLSSYIKLMLDGEDDVLWPGKPLYFSKTSGTTSGVKYIPISKESISNHINAARNALLLYINETGKSEFVDGKLIFLSGSPTLDKKAGIPTGRLSGIVNHHVPSYLRSNQMPNMETNCIEDWEQKVDRIVEETLHEDMTLISGIPPWVQMYFDRLTEKTGKRIKEIFPNFGLFVYGGVNFEPYRSKLEKSIGGKIDTIELYPASEGFIAYQDKQPSQGLLLNLNDGIFYEFIKAADFFNVDAKRIELKDVELDINYAIILSTNAGLWAYNIGDTVKFVSLAPYRIIVSGRIKHFISAFGEHVIAEEVEFAMKAASEKFNLKIVEFTVAPQVNPVSGALPYHEWLIEFEEEPKELNVIAQFIDKLMQDKNVYYADLIEGNILQPLKISLLTKNAFINYMRSEGKLGGQNKVPRLSNDRSLADQLKQWLV